MQFGDPLHSRHVGDGGNQVLTNSIAAVAILSLYVAPYFANTGGQPFFFLIPDAGILAILSWLDRDSAVRKLGLAMPIRHAAAAGAILIAGIALMQVVMTEISTTHGIRIIDGHRLFSLSQVLHQEIVLRAILLGLLRQRFRRDLSIAVVAALVFTTLHPVYTYLSEDLWLPAIALATIFTFDVSANLLFLRVDHIAFSFATHASWNLARFGDGYVSVADPYRQFSEAQTFIAIEGSVEALSIAVTFLLVVLVLRKRSTNPMFSVVMN